MMKVVIICIFAVLVLYLYLIAPRMCKKPDRKAFLGVRYAHRGLFDNEGDAPENSLAAFKKAVDAGYGIELDVQLSKDKVPVVFHDAGLYRMCGVDGNVWQYTLEELQQMKLKKSNQTIPTFADALAVIDGKVPVIIEYKMDVPDTLVCELGDQLLKDYKGVYCMESFDPSAVRWYKKHRPQVLRGQLSMDFSKEEWSKGKLRYWLLSHLLTNVQCRPDFIAYDWHSAHMLSRRVCGKLGALSAAWTVRSQEDYEKAKDDFDIFIFDSFRL